MTNTREPSKCCRPVNKRRKINLSFAGCGFNGIYHVGVAVCLKEYAPHLLLNRISGASAGAIAACYLLCDLSVSSVTSDVLELVRLARKRTLGPFSPTFNVQDVLEEGLRKNLPEDAHLRVSGKLHISLTQLPGFRNVIVSRFYSKDDLIQALLASSFVPFFSGSHPPKFHGGYYMDGGFSNNLPTLDENTITVSPFCGETDICPRDDSSQLFHVTLANTSIEVSKQNVHRIIRILYPPKPEVLTKMCMQGFEDTLRFLRNNNLIKCAKYIAVESTYLVSSKYDEIDEIEHDPECNDCLIQRQEALGATLPESVRAIFQEAVDAANKGLMNWLFSIPGMKILSFLALPYTLPFEIAYATFTKLVSGPPHMPNNFMLMCEFIMDQLEHFMHIKSEPSTDCVACTCHLQESEYCGMGLAKDTIPDTTVHAKTNISIKVTIGKEKEPVEKNQEPKPTPKNFMQQPSLGHNKLEHYGDDTFENILSVTAHHDSLVTFYYLDEYNKVKVAEIFEVTDAEENLLAEPIEPELESRFSQHTDEGRKNSESPDESSCNSSNDSVVSSEPESDWNETDFSRTIISSVKESDLRPESDQNTTKKSSHRKSERSKSTRRSNHTNKPTITT